MSGCPVPKLPAAQQKGIRVRAAPETAAPFLPAEPYTCGACGIQFQFYNNLLEHMQSHAGKGPTVDGGGVLKPPLSLPPSDPAKGRDGQGQPAAALPKNSPRTWEPWLLRCKPRWSVPCGGSWLAGSVAREGVGAGEGFQKL